ncbi:transcription antitermination factor NusB [Candidatus Peregrinibacteria bacterium]|nr:MAG: transcription antitermination factor NusB [Candidatus Peregrinibacteria bacterium]
MKQRHLARQVAVQVIVSLLLQDADPEEVITFVHEDLNERLASRSFLTLLVYGVLQNREEIDKHIQYFAPEWPIVKLDPVERAILELGSFELTATDTPPAIVINESVELAKEFGDDTAGKFINGVLSSLARHIGKIPAPL